MEKQPELPHNDWIENAVIAGMLWEKQWAEKFIDKIKPEWFYREKTRTIFEVLTDLTDRGQWLGIDNLMDLGLIFQKRGLLEKIGGFAGLSEASDNPGFEVNNYAQELKTKYVYRQLIVHQGNLPERFEQACRAGEDPHEFANQVFEELEEIRDEPTENRARTRFEVGQSAVAELDMPVRARAISGVRDLDGMTGGFLSGELVIVTGEINMGKTILCFQIAEKTCETGRHGLFVSCEMRPEHVETRSMSARTGIYLKKIRERDLSKEERERIIKQVGRICKTCRTLGGNPTLENIKAEARRMARAKTLDWVIIDYDELVGIEATEEFEAQGKIATELKHLAIELQIPVILISQLRKPLNPEDRKSPTLARLYGHQAKAKHASCVVYVDRPWVREFKGSETDAMISVLKNRDGAVGKIKCKFDHRKFRFLDTDEEAIVP